MTSAYHMPRAMKIMQREGTNPIAALDDFNRPEEDGINSIFRSDHLEKQNTHYMNTLGFFGCFLNLDIGCFRFKMV